VGIFKNLKQLHHIHNSKRKKDNPSSQDDLAPTYLTLENQGSHIS